MPCRPRLPKFPSIEAEFLTLLAFGIIGVVLLHSPAARPPKPNLLFLSSPAAYTALGTWIRVSWQRRSKTLKSNTPLNVSRT